MTPPSDSLEALARRAESGDRAAFAALLERFHGQVESWIRLRLGAAARAVVEPEDVFQETMLRALEGASEFRWGGEKACANWLARIAQNVIQEHLRRATRHRLEPLASDPTDSTASPSKAERRGERFRRLEASLDSLDPVSRQVVTLSRLEGRSLQEIAARVGRSPNAVALVLMRALRKLRAHMGDTESLGLPDQTLRDEGDRHDG
jgi:RNA polymerase sigma-70 factor (ECF subfamily)